jgi:hypothetical protein
MGRVFSSAYVCEHIGREEHIVALIEKVRKKMDARIHTNNVPRSLISKWELSEKEQREFDYVSEENGASCFFRYRGQVYYLGNFMRVNAPIFKGWDGVAHNSMCTCVRYTKDYESIVVGTFY